MIKLITGGVKSGKSSYAVNLALKYKPERIFIATAEPFDEQMRKRIENHKKQRLNLFKTIEEPIYLTEALKQSDKATVCIIDCITVWTGNLLHYNKLNQIDKFIKSLKKQTIDTIIVTNEVGMGIIPDNRLARDYMDILGEINAKIASLADSVTLMISGIPIKIK